jgi:hypothetical protein
MGPGQQGGGPGHVHAPHSPCTVSVTAEPVSAMQRRLKCSSLVSLAAASSSLHAWRRASRAGRQALGGAPRGEGKAQGWRRLSTGRGRGVAGCARAAAAAAAALLPLRRAPVAAQLQRTLGGGLIDVGADVQQLLDLCGRGGGGGAAVCGRAGGRVSKAESGGGAGSALAARLVAAGWGPPAPPHLALALALLVLEEQLALQVDLRARGRGAERGGGALGSMGRSLRGRRQRARGDRRRTLCWMICSSSSVRERSSSCLKRSSVLRQAVREVSGSQHRGG